MMGMGGGGFGGMNPMETGRWNVPFTGGNMGMDMHRIPIVGNMFQNPYDQFKQQQMQNAAGAYSMYRPEAAQSWMNAQNMQSAQLQPMNNALAAMYGTGATQGFEAQNPFGPTAFTRGAAVGTNPNSTTPAAQPGGGGGGGGAWDTFTGAVAAPFQAIGNLDYGAGWDKFKGAVAAPFQWTGEQDWGGFGGGMGGGSDGGWW